MNGGRENAATLTTPLAVALTLVAVHFGAPLAYYVEAKKWLKRPWDVKRDLQHTPTVTLAILTYNEAKHVEDKREDICRQGYTCDRFEIIVVNSASTDGAAEKARWRTVAHCVLKQYNSQVVNALHVLIKLELSYLGSRKGVSKMKNTHLHQSGGFARYITPRIKFYDEK